jgi:hypothetical protein
MAHQATNVYEPVIIPNNTHSQIGNEAGTSKIEIKRLTSNGRVDPRPSDILVPSNIQAPGYINAVSTVGISESSIA